MAVITSSINELEGRQSKAINTIISANSEIRDIKFHLKGIQTEVRQLARKIGLQSGAPQVERELEAIMSRVVVKAFSTLAMREAGHNMIAAAMHIPRHKPPARSNVFCSQCGDHMDKELKMVHQVTQHGVEYTTDGMITSNDTVEDGGVEIGQHHFEKSENLAGTTDPFVSSMAIVEVQWCKIHE